MTLSKPALITDITEQDGSYLAELLLGKGYIVHSIKLHSLLITHGYATTVSSEH